MKIVYCINAICYLGGMEMVTIVKANALAEIPDNEVYIIVADNQSSFRVHPLSPKVHLVDLQINYYQDGGISKPALLRSIIAKRRLHKKRLANTLREINPDIVISTGHSEKYFLPEIKGQWKSVREMHCVKNSRLLYAHSLKERVKERLIYWYDFKFKIWNYDCIVLLTQEDKQENWKESEKIEVIPNPLTFHCENTASLEAKNFIAAGRLHYQKNFASLVRSFKYVATAHPDWSLEIYGDGELKNELQKQIKQLGLEQNVFLMGFSDNVRDRMLESSCFVLSSQQEGFGLVLIEAMSCGVPVVSYTCHCGPKDIVHDGVNGFLVPVNDEKTLADKMCYLIEHPDLRKKMGKAAKESSEKYQLEHVIPMWMDLFQRLVNE